MSVATTAYRDGRAAADSFGIDQIRQQLTEPGTTVWVDLCEPTDDEIQLWATTLGLHELAAGHAAAKSIRPKFDRFADHVFMIAPIVALRGHESDLRASSLAIFASKEWLVTIRDKDASLNSAGQAWSQETELMRRGTAYMLYSLLEAIVDSYFDVAAQFDAEFDKVGDLIFSGHPLTPARQKNWFEMRRASVKFRQLVMPMREVLAGLLRADSNVVTEEMYPYFQDVYDQVLRVADSSDALRDVSNTIMETSLSLRDYRQNQIMKQVSSWAAIIAIPTLVTGYFGMNVPYPTFGEPIGVVVSAVLLVGASGGLYALFRKIGWL